MKSAKQLFKRRSDRVRVKVKSKANDRLRLTVFKSNSHIYAQIIDDRNSKTLVAASTNEPELRANLKHPNISAASKVGKLIGERASKLNLEKVVFDRGGYLYHGKIKALADSAREAGLKF